MREKPIGREAVSAALVAAATELIIEKGMAVSVRDIAARAGVNHGLVHTYFDGKEALFQAALDAINERANADVDADGFPPVDLASRRGGELAKAIARVRIESGRNPFSSHPVSRRWRDAVARSRPELSGEEVNAMVASSAALGLGWAMYGDQLAEILGIGDDARAELDGRIFDMIAELGGLPRRTDVPA